MKKPRRGRPPKPGGPFTVNLNLAVSDSMVEEIERVLRREPSQSRLEFIREAIARALKRRRRGKD